jgi:hypothetical protein
MKSDDKTMFVLWHQYERNGQEELKLLGIFSSRKLALAAKKRMKTRPGFREHPSGLIVAESFVDRDLWPDGFITQTGFS